MRANKAIRCLSGAALASALTLGVVASAYAVPTTPNGSFSGAVLGATITTTYGGGPSDWEIGVTTTQIQVTGGSRVISGASNPYLGDPNNLLTANGGPVTVGDPYTVPISVYNLVTGGITPFSVGIDGLTFTFTNEVVTSISDGNIGLAFVGTLTGDTTAVANSPYLLGSSVDFSIGFTESSETGTISVAQAIDAPANPALDTPEPATMTVLAVGLIGLGAARRRNR